MTDFMDLARERYSVRSFADKKVEPNKIELLLEAMRVAPTACNYQPQKVWVLQSEEELQKARQVLKYHFNAPLIFLVGYNDRISWKNNLDGTDSGIIDASISATHMMLEAANIGLGSTFVRYFDEKQVKAVFNISEHIHIICALPVGYPAENAMVSKLHFDKKPISEFVMSIQA